jgi:hypothetical protein
MRVPVSVRLPDVPVIVRVYCPTAAVLLAVSVSELFPVVGFGVKADAVTPLGTPDTARFTLPVKPYSGVTVIVDVPEPPWLMLKLLGEDESAKIGAWTATVMFVVAVTLPDVPVIASVLVLGGAELLAVSVSKLLVEVGFVPHEAVTPLGNADARVRLTLPLKPPASVTVTVVELEVPWITEIVLDEANIQKPGTWGPANVSIRLCPFALPHPVTRS